MLARAFHKPIAVFLVAAVLMGLMAPSCTYAQAVSQLGAVDGIGGVTDVIVGHNNRGPYSLSWTNFDAGSALVVVNGRTLQKGADYNIDPAKGIIAFNSVLVNDAIVRVTYQTQPGKSKRATTGPNIPITLNLRSSASGNLRVTGLYEGDSTNPNTGKSILGIGGDRTWTSSKLNSQFLISQSNDSGGSQGAWERSVLKLGGDTSVGKVKFSGSYLHAGEAFGGAKEYGTGVGKDAMSFATAFAPTKTVQANASYQSSEDTAGAGKGNRIVTNAQNVVFTPVNSTNLSFSHTTSELTSAAGNRDLTATSGIQFSSTAIKRLALRSALTQKTSDASGAERVFSAGMTARPVDQVNVDINYATVENRTVGEQATTDVSVTAAPVKQVAIQAAYTGVDSTVAGQSTKTNVAIQAAPIANVQVAASAAGSITGSTRQFQRDFSVTSTPARFAKLMAMFSQKGINSLDDVTKGAELQLTPARNTRFVAGYKCAESGPQVLTIHDYLAQTKQWDFLSFTGTYRQRDLDNADAPDSASMSLSLAPARLFSLTGEYQSNPEDKTGAVQNFNTTSVGLTTHFGSIGVQTSYSAKNEYLAQALSDVRDLNLAVPVFGHGKLTTGCRLNRMLGSGDQSSRSYLLGYQHSIGADFSLSLTGYYTQFIQNKTFQPDKTEAGAEASVGAKF